MSTAEQVPTSKQTTTHLPPALTTDPVPTSSSTIKLVGSSATETAAGPTASSSSIPPSVTITPASPSESTSATFDGPTPADSTTGTTAASTMKDKLPTDSETALVSTGTSSSVNKEKNLATSGSGEATSSEKPGAIEALTRKLSGKASAAKTTPRTNATTATTTTMSEEKITPVSPKTTTSSPAVASTSKPTTTASTSAAQTARTSTQKKKRKRTGFAAFLLALGCLSASEFEDEPSSKPATERPTTTSKPSDAKTSVKTEKPLEVGKKSPAAATSGSSKDAVASSSTSSPGTSTPIAAPTVADVVVAPAAPVSVPVDETAGVTSAAVQQPGSGSELLSTPHRGSVTRDVGLADSTPPHGQGVSNIDASRSETSGGYSDMPDTDMLVGNESGQGDDQDGDYPLEEEYEDEEDRLIAQGGMGIPIDEHGQPAPLLPLMDRVHAGRKCLVLDLDETLLHSSFKMLPNADYIVPVEIEGQTHNVYVIKRPGVDNFLKEMGRIYEVVVFTASLSKYADPVLDMLDVNRVVRHRLFRESCYNHKGNYVKDLSQLGRDIHETIIIDNSPASYIFHPNNAVPVSTWFNDPHDTELTDLCPFLTDLSTVTDVRGVLDGSI